jgi:hypothetical protein
MTPDESGQEMNQAHVGTTHGGCLTLGPQGPFRPLIKNKTKQTKTLKASCFGVSRRLVFIP